MEPCGESYSSPVSIREEGRKGCILSCPEVPYHQARAEKKKVPGQASPIAKDEPAQGKRGKRLRPGQPAVCRSK